MRKEGSARVGFADLRSLFLTSVSCARNFYSDVRLHWTSSCCVNTFPSSYQLPYRICILWTVQNVYVSNTNPLFQPL